MEHKFEKLTAGIALSTVLLSGCSNSNPGEIKVEIPEAQPQVETVNEDSNGDVSSVDTDVEAYEFSAPPEGADVQSTSQYIGEIAWPSDEVYENSTLSFTPSSEGTENELFMEYLFSPERQDKMGKIINDLGQRILHLASRDVIGYFQGSNHNSGEQQDREGAIEGWSRIARNSETPGFGPQAEDTIELSAYQLEGGKIDLSKGILEIVIEDKDAPEDTDTTEYTLAVPYSKFIQFGYEESEYPSEEAFMTMKFEVDGTTLTLLAPSVLTEDMTWEEAMAADQAVIDYMYQYVIDLKKQVDAYEREFLG